VTSAQIRASRGHAREAVQASPEPDALESIGLDIDSIDEDSRRAAEAALLSLARGLDDYDLEPRAGSNRAH
jgi:hypothetical protein